MRIQSAPMRYALIVLGLSLVILINGCAPTGMTPSEPVIEEAIEEPQMEPESGEVVVLRASVVQYEGWMPVETAIPAYFESAARLGLLVEGMERVADALSTPERQVRIETAEVRAMVAPGAPACRPDMFGGIVEGSAQCFTTLSIDTCRMMTVGSAQTFDLYMVESVPALHTREQNDFVPLNPETLGRPLEQFVGPSRRTFEDWAVGQASSPLVLIYNPDILGDLPDKVSADQVLEMTQEHPLVIPPHTGIIGAMSESLLGPDFEERSPWRRSFYATITEMVGQRIDEFVVTGQIRSTETVDLIRGFEEQQIAWTIQDPMFLGALAARGYAGPVATTSLPVINEIGGTAMMVGWGVPGSSEHSDLAWAFIGKLVEDPSVIAWALSNGGLPVNEAGINVLLEDPGLAEGWLPADLLARDNGLTRLIDSAAESTAWRIPPDVPIETYNERLLPASTDILRRLFNGEIGYYQGRDEWLMLLAESGLLRD